MQHARIASILKHAAELGATDQGGDVSLLTHPAELELIREMLRLPEIVEVAAGGALEPHHLPHYAIELAGIFHSFYRQCRVVSSDPADAAITARSGARGRRQDHWLDAAPDGSARAGIDVSLR